MMTRQSTPLGSSSPAAFQDERFAVSRVETAKLESGSASITFEVEVHNHRLGQKVFCGLLDRELRSGVGLSIDTESGEVVDLINDQGIIGYLNNCPLLEGKMFSLRLTMDKFGSTHICSAEIAGEHILYPAVLLNQVEEIGVVLGSTLTEDHGITFEKTRLQVNPAASIDR